MISAVHADEVVGMGRGNLKTKEWFLKPRHIMDDSSKLGSVN
jgi:hypothetical protein